MWSFLVPVPDLATITDADWMKTVEQAAERLDVSVICVRRRVIFEPPSHWGQSHRCCAAAYRA